MDRLEFMRKLKSLLSDITPGEREEAMQYYNDYFDDAGVENEEEVIISLGSPEKVARTIREGLKENGEGGEYTERGYSNSKAAKEERQEIVSKDKKTSLSGGMIALIIILCIFAIPVFFSLVSRIFGAGFGLITGILGLVFGVAICALALGVAALVLIGFGIGSLFSIPVAGILMIGAGILCAGLSLFFLWLTVWVFGTAIPAVVRAAIRLFKKIFYKKEGEAV